MEVIQENVPPPVTIGIDGRVDDIPGCQGQSGFAIGQRLKMIITTDELQIGTFNLDMAFDRFWNGVRSEVETPRQIPI